MILKNALIFDEDFEKVKKDIEITGEKIVGTGDNLDGDAFDFEGCVVLPGFIDIHTHGCGGV